MWQGQIEELSKHHKLILWDMRGHGQFDYPTDPSAYSEALTIADMAALLDQVGDGPGSSAIIDGLSLGGYMSLSFHRAHPNRVSALLIIDSGPGGPAPASPGTSTPAKLETASSAKGSRCCNLRAPNARA